MHSVICGLDAASTSAAACVLSTSGAVLHELRLSVSRPSEEQLLALLPVHSVVILESTGRYHLPWARRLANAGHTVYVLNPLLAKRLVSARNALRQNKTDKIDARQLAEIGRRDLADLGTYLFKEDPLRARLRSLCETRSFQRALLTNTLKSAQHLLGMILPEAAMLSLSANKGLAEFFLSVRSLEHLRRLRRPTVERSCCTHTDTFIQLLKQPLSAAHLFDALLPSLHSQLKVVVALREQLIDLDAQVRAALADLPQPQDAKLARTIPGFGARSVPPILACMPPNWRSWGNKRTIARKLQALFGLDPKLRESGSWKGKVRMSKRGLEIARTALFQVAVCSLLYDPDMRRTYDQQRAIGKHHLVALSHVMRRQLQRLVAVLYDQRPFTPIPPLQPASPC